MLAILVDTQVSTSPSCILTFCSQTIERYGIATEDIYNFDESGFMMGVISTAKAVTGADKAGRAFFTQPGNKEWVTVIECINAHE
jgi:hypothetical protein